MTLRVNGDFIPEDAIRVELKRLIRFYAEHMPETQLRGELSALLIKAKEQAVGGKLLLEEARRLNIAVSDEAVKRRVAGMAEDSGGNEALCALLKRQNLTEKDFLRSLISGMQVDELVKKITAGVAEPTEAQAQRYYDRHPEEFQTRERARVRHILLKADSNGGDDRATARAKIEVLRQQIADGADFGELAGIHSECPSGPQSGGLLGWIYRGTTVPEFDRWAFALEKGAVSEVVETPLGFHVLQGVDREASRQAPFEDVRERIFDIIRHSQRGFAIAKYVQSLKEKAVIEDDGEDIAVADLDLSAMGLDSQR